MVWKAVKTYILGYLLGCYTIQSCRWVPLCLMTIVFPFSRSKWRACLCINVTDIGFQVFVVVSVCSDFGPSVCDTMSCKGIQKFWRNNLPLSSNLALLCFMEKQLCSSAMKVQAVWSARTLVSIYHITWHCLNICYRKAQISYE